MSSFFGKSNQVLQLHVLLPHIVFASISPCLGFHAFRGPFNYVYFGEQESVIQTDIVHLLIWYLAGVCAIGIFLLALTTNNKQKWINLVRSCYALGVGISMLYILFSTNWQRSYIHAEAEFACHEHRGIRGDIGVLMGARSINITMEGSVSQAGGNTTVFYNEEIDLTMMRDLFLDYKLIRSRGAPYPLLSITEHLVSNLGDLRWGTQVKHAGYFSGFCLWTSFGFWLFSAILSYIVVCYALYSALLSGLFMMLSGTLYHTMQPSTLQVILEGKLFHFHYGCCFWLLFVIGAVNVIGSVVFLVFHKLRPKSVQFLFAPQQCYLCDVRIAQLRTATEANSQPPCRVGQAYVNKALIEETSSVIVDPEAPNRLSSDTDISFTLPVGDKEQPRCAPVCTDQGCRYRHPSYVSAEHCPDDVCPKLHKKILRHPSLRDVPVPTGHFEEASAAERLSKLLPAGNYAKFNGSLPRSFSSRAVKRRDSALLFPFNNEFELKEYQSLAKSASWSGADRPDLEIHIKHVDDSTETAQPVALAGDMQDYFGQYWEDSFLPVPEKAASKKLTRHQSILAARADRGNSSTDSLIRSHSMQVPAYHQHIVHDRKHLFSTVPQARDPQVAPSLNYCCSARVKHDDLPKVNEETQEAQTADYESKHVNYPLLIAELRVKISKGTFEHSELEGLPKWVRRAVLSFDEEETKHDNDDNNDATVETPLLQSDNHSDKGASYDGSPTSFDVSTAVTRTPLHEQNGVLGHSPRQSPSAKAANSVEVSEEKRQTASDDDSIVTL